MRPPALSEGVSFRAPTGARERAPRQQESDRFSNKLTNFAAATSKEALEENKSHQSNNPHTERLAASAGHKKQESEVKQSNSTEEKSTVRVDYIVNKELISLLDSAGVTVNRTIRDLLKLYPSEKVEGAIALLKARKRDNHVSNPSGYFVKALQGDWGSQNIGVEESGDREVDKEAIFRHWYDLARSLGYCSGQEIREGVQFVCLSGSWEKWEEAVKRGYSLAYLKKIVQRNRGN